MLQLRVGRWKSGHGFEIDSELVRNYFNKTKQLLFSDESAKKEEAFILRWLGERSGLSVLDLGCGNGRWAEALRPRLAHYVGVDFSNELLEEALTWVGEG